MNRSGYSDDCDDCDGWELIMYRGAVQSAIRGKRGQKLLRELADAMDVMPVKRLIAESLEVNGEYCALGVVGAARGIPMAGIDPYDQETIANTFDIAPALAKEIAFENDDGEWRHDNPEQRWIRVRQWVNQQIKETDAKRT